MSFIINSFEFVNLLEWLGIEMNDPNYVNMKKARESATERSLLAKQTLLKYGLVGTNTTSLEQLKYLNDVYQRKYEYKII